MSRFMFGVSGRAVLTVVAFLVISHWVQASLAPQWTERVEEYHAQRA